MDKIHKEIWRKRYIIYNFAISDLKIKYRNSVLGFFWTFLEPLLMLAVLYVVFTSIFNSKIEYFPLYLLLGIIMWNMFVRGTQNGLFSILARGSVLTQIYIPREIPPISSVITSFFMLCFELAVFVCFMVFFQFTPTSTIIFLPLLIFLEFILIVGISLPLSVLNVKYRDIQFIWNLILQVGFFLTPIFYKLDILPKNIQYILHYIPTTEIIEMSHESVLYNQIPNTESVLVLIGEVFMVLIIGYIIFRKIQTRIMEEL